MIAERILMAMLIGGIALGCSFVLRPFFSAILWATILVYATWPVFRWLRTRLGLPRGLVALIMVATTALVIVLPLALAVPGGAADVKVARVSLEAWLAEVPPAPHWLGALPFLGALLADTWNAWAADLSIMAAFFRPYLGMFAEQGLSLLLGVAGGLVQFFLALFVAFFLWFSGDTLGPRLQLLVHRIAGRYGPELIATTTRAVRGTVYGILGTAIIQGFLTAFGLSLAGVPRVVLLGTVTAFPRRSSHRRPTRLDPSWTVAASRRPYRPRYFSTHLWRPGGLRCRPSDTPLFYRPRRPHSLCPHRPRRSGRRPWPLAPWGFFLAPSCSASDGCWCSISLGWNPLPPLRYRRRLSFRHPKAGPYAPKCARHTA